ncbi:unnamed protein product [Schistocephalus solidus]|uniref:Secreted protein n=1 Tax=Schistocephalus solidus TaxID=70667 RepID=A0A183SIE5_SCHSO|nr:unnamed protein product [Schistocephalus solidus]
MKRSQLGIWSMLVFFGVADMFLLMSFLALLLLMVVLRETESNFLNFSFLQEWSFAEDGEAHQVSKEFLFVELCSVA